MKNDGAEGLVKLFVYAVIVGIALAAAIFIGGPLLALYTLIKGWDNVSTPIKTGAIVLPVIGAGFAVWSIAQQQVVYWEWSSILLLSSPFLSLGMVGIAYYRARQKFAPSNLPMPAGNLDRLCSYCGSANRPGFKYCQVCGRAAYGVTHPRIKGP